MAILPKNTARQQGELRANLTDEEIRSALERAQIHAGRLPVGRHIMVVAGGKVDTDNPDHTVIWLEFNNGFRLRLIVDADPAARHYDPQLWRRYVRGICQFAQLIQTTGINVRGGSEGDHALASICQRMFGREVTFTGGDFPRLHVERPQ